MSWYVSYYLGYKTKEGKIYPLYPFDCFGNLRPIIEKSRSFASNLWEKFNRVTLEETTEELKKHFPDGDNCLWGYDDDQEKKEEPPWCFWLDTNELPDTDYIKKGYFLQEDISNYERDDGYWDGFYHMLTPDEYARKMDAELKFGVPKPKKDAEGYEIEEYSCGEYAFYAYPDHDSAEYESFMIKQALWNFEYSQDIPEGAKIVVLQTNG